MKAEEEEEEEEEEMEEGKETSGDCRCRMEKTAERETPPLDA